MGWGFLGIQLPPIVRPALSFKRCSHNLNLTLVHPSNFAHRRRGRRRLPKRENRATRRHQRPLRFAFHHVLGMKGTLLTASGLVRSPPRSSSSLAAARPEMRRGVWRVRPLRKSFNNPGGISQPPESCSRAPERFPVADRNT